jgi:hypothetical protein
MVQNPAFDAFFGFVVITNAVFIGTWVKNQDVLSFSPNLGQTKRVTMIDHVCFKYIF